ncbi:MAG TPA: amidohydrolase [Saprospiraceae bacterium]|nr:amidohydrolase [Saprospiraceae bacterium]
MFILRCFITIWGLLTYNSIFSQTPDLLLINGHIYTSDDSNPICEAVAIIDNEISAIGTNLEINKLKGPQTKVIDLQGKFAMPGLIEGHGHMYGLGKSLVELNLLNTTSWAEILKMVKLKELTIPKSEWLIGRGWHQEKWPNMPSEVYQGYPSNKELSSITPDKFVILYHASGHALIANAKLMSIANITASTPDPVGGRIIRDADGNPTGVLEENAMDLLEVAFKKFSVNQSQDTLYSLWKKTINIAQEECIKNGITGFHDAGVSIQEIKYYSRLADENELKVRMWVMINDSFVKIKAFSNSLPIIRYAKQMLTVKAIKQYMDGALGSHGAWLLASYDDKPGFTGQNVTPLLELETMAAFSFEHNLQLCIHAIGDRGNREVLNLYEKIFNTNKDRQNLRWRIEHAQHVSPDDFDKFRSLGVIASMQAIHCTSDGPFVEKRLGKQRAQFESYAWRSLLDKGVHLANGTDTPVERLNPFECLYAAVTRKRLDNGFSFYPEQKMTRTEALKSYTIWNAYAAFEEDIKGSLVAGKLADIVVLDTDLLNCTDEKIATAKVFTTISNGKIVYQLH